MKAIEIIGHVDEQHRLLAEMPPGVPPGPVKIVIEVPLTKECEDTWAADIAAVWARDWDDPREDIYTLEDGEPVNERG